MRSRLIASAALALVLCGAHAPELNAGRLILEPAQSSGADEREFTKRTGRGHAGIADLAGAGLTLHSGSEAA